MGGPARRDSTRYLRKTSKFASTAPLKADSAASVRRFGRGEARSLAAEIKRRDAYARHRRHDLYYERARGLRDTTVVEILFDTKPREIDKLEKQARQHADLIEQVVLISTTLFVRREKLHSAIALGRTLADDRDFDLMVGPASEFVRTQKQRARKAAGLRIDKKFADSFQKCGFPSFVSFLQSEHDLAARVARSMRWLHESRCDTNMEAAIVKTAISLEALLIFSGEPVAHSLAERAAFLLSDDTEMRGAVDSSVKRFYDARSRIVHGGQRPKSPDSDVLEGADRIAMLLMLTISANGDLWNDEKGLREWCDTERWSAPSKMRRPFQRVTLTSAIKLFRAY